MITGTVGVLVVAPTATPTRTPTSAPTIKTGTFLCPYFSWYSSFATCTVYLCGGYTVTMSVCANGGSFTGDTYFTFVDSVGTVLVTNDDSCGLGSQILYTVPAGTACATFTLREGCYSGSACTGTREEKSACA